MNMLLEASKNIPFWKCPLRRSISMTIKARTSGRSGWLMIYKNMTKFALTSLGSFVVDYIVYALALLFLAAVPTSLKFFSPNGIARVTSSIFNYSTIKRLVFKNDDSILKIGTDYFSLAVVLFILDTADSVLLLRCL